ncbi:MULTISPECIES: sulfatase family protein [Galbibacter]|uniref:Arylsulfatase A family protein n=1 Tax=Galbibacter orientalis DSM 19592 TaxID=926559 RepID=I3C8Q4_9FLAO|nr:sulfatase [Galbibacter orientalis]EIJ39997.1 arylsulfatase A family protein [Galbibacter orientalis DSM 19592]
MKSISKLIPFLILAILLTSCKEKTDQEENNTEVVAGAEKPNILFIMADDHAFQAISAYGSEISKLAPTPNIDRIAKNGAIFNHTYCTNSICGPSRAVILTGKHSHINGFRQNGERFDGDQPTLPKKLQTLGYQTALVGKWHLYGYPQGFDYWNIIDDQGHYYNPDFVKMGDSIQIEGYATDIITEDAISWLENKKVDNKPFFMMLHHKAPHRNWMPPLRYLTVYDSIKFPLPDSYFDKHESQVAAQQQLQTIYDDMYEGHDLKLSKKFASTELSNNPWTNDFDRMNAEQRRIWDEAYLPKNNAFWEANLHGKALDEWKGQRYLHDYLATVKAVDDGVGKVLDYLEENGLSDNTIVVYTSDQGFYLGEKGFFDKRFMYEESFRMPFLIQYPKAIKPGTVVDALTQNLDFAQTFLDYAGGNDLTEGMQGKSIKPLLEGTVEDDDFRDAIYYHYYDYPAFHMVKKHYGVKTKRYKLMHFYDDIDTWEFYDLEEDPNELHNAINDEDYEEVIAKLHARLKELQKEYGVTEKEFEQASEKKIDNNFKNFDRMRGTPIE